VVVEWNSSLVYPCILHTLLLLTTVVTMALPRSPQGGPLTPACHRDWLFHSRTAPALLLPLLPARASQAQ
jgi:hypothetical protein